MQVFIAGYCEISLIKSVSERRNYFEPGTDGYYNRKANTSSADTIGNDAGGISRGTKCYPAGAIELGKGCHYTSTRFIQLVSDKELRQSMSRKGNCWDNAPQESFFGHMKDEIDVSECSKYREVKAIVDDWMDYYNNSRYQWQLAKLSPNEYYEYITTGIYPLEGIVSCKVDKQTFPRTNK